MLHDFKGEKAVNQDIPIKRPDSHDVAHYPKFENPLIMVGSRYPDGIWWDKDVAKSAEKEGYDGVVGLNPKALDHSIIKEAYKNSTKLGDMDEATIQRMVKEHPELVNWDDEHNQYIPLTKDAVSTERGVDKNKLLDRFNAGEITAAELKQAMKAMPATDAKLPPRDKPKQLRSVRLVTPQDDRRKRKGLQAAGVPSR